MARTHQIVLPFTTGQNEAADSKMQPEGTLSLARNVRLRKDGRFGCRYGYTGQSQTSNPLLSGASESTLRAQQVLNLDERLVLVGGQGAAQPSNVYAFVAQTLFAWERIDGGFGVDNIEPVTGFTDMGRMPSPGSDITRMDVAATSGTVALVYETGTASQAHIFRASDNTTLLANVSVTGTRPRVVAVGSVFFFAAIDTSDGHVRLYQYNPASNANMTAKTNPASSGDAIVAWDMMADPITGGFVIAIHRNTPATSIIKLDSTGAVTATITGPTTAFDHVSVLGSTTGIAKYHLAAVLTSNQTVSLYSYTTSGTLSPASPTTALGSGLTTDKQCGIIENDTSICTYISTNVDIPAVSVIALHSSDHSAGSGGTTYLDTVLQAKPFGPASFQAFGLQLSEGSENGIDFQTDYIGLARATEQLVAQSDKFIGKLPADNHLPQISKDSSTGKYYWPRLVLDTAQRGNPVVGEFDYLAGGPLRQATTLGGIAYLSGGAIQAYDFRQLYEIGFQNSPVILSAVTSTGAGSLPSSCDLDLVVTWEWYGGLGNLHLSPLSTVATVTMGPSDNTITLLVSTPKSLKDGVSASVGGPVRVVVYRTLQNMTQLRRAYTADADQTVANYGEPITITLLLSDDDIATNDIVYTQSGRGALGTILEHESPLGAKYLWRFGKRIISGGLPNPYRVQVSKELFPGEPVEWSGDESFLIDVPFPVVGVAAQDLRGFIFGRTQIYQFGGQGPDDSGDTPFNDVLALPTSAGLYNFLSLVETPLGIMYQADPDKIFLIPRDGSAPAWFSQPVRSTLAAFPNITSATLLREEQLVSFTCNDDGGTDSRVISYDLRAQTWVVDDFTSATVIRSGCQYNGRLTYVDDSNGKVYLEDSTFPPAAFTEHALRTGTIRPFQGSWGKLTTVTFLGEWRGPCKLTCLISYDDGVSFTTLRTFDLSTGYSVGDTVRKQWYPRRRKGDRFLLEFQAAANDNGDASEGLVFNEYVLSVIGETGRARLHATTATKASDRG